MSVRVSTPLPKADAPFHQQLRAETAASHATVDAAFARYRLGERAGYGAFLCAHAEALRPVERWIGATSGRSAALLADLAALDIPAPAFAPLDWPASDAGMWGASYVIEGSRWGGQLLQKMVGDGLPKAYLAAPFSSAAWRGLLGDIDRHAASGDDGWRRDAVRHARAVFDLFARAAARWSPDGR